MKPIYLLLGLVLLFGCVLSPPLKISDIEDHPDKYLGEKVMVAGTVKDSFKLGSLSGFTLEDDTGEIFVAADRLPKEGSNTIVSGTVMKEFLVGHYILADE